MQRLQTLVHGTRWLETRTLLIQLSTVEWEVAGVHSLEHRSSRLAEHRSYGYQARDAVRAVPLENCPGECCAKVPAQVAAGLEARLAATGDACTWKRAEKASGLRNHWHGLQGMHPCDHALPQAEGVHVGQCS